MSKKLNEENQEQYKHSGTPTVVQVKSLQEKKNDDIDLHIRQLNDRIDSQYKVIDKLVRDMKRIKDQISEIAGRLPRG